METIWNEWLVGAMRGGVFSFWNIFVNGVPKKSIDLRG
jgi:hypothetical protein